MNFRYTAPLLLSILILSFQAVIPNKQAGADDTAVMKGIFGLPLDSPEFKGKDYKEIAGYLKGLGINAVVGAPLDRGLISGLRAEGIRVYAEVAIFAGEEYWLKDPRTRPVNSKGEPIARQDWYAGLCPSQEGLRKEKLAAIERIASDYDVNGIWLDFIRYPCHWEVANPLLEETCFCEVCLGKFKSDAGVNLPVDLKNTKEKAEFISSHHRQEWEAWRYGQITGFVRQARNILAKKDPGLELGLFAVPWTQDDFDNAIIRIIAQDFKALAPYVDIFSPMAYHKMSGRDISWIGKIVRYMRQATGKQVIPILQAEGLSEAELSQAVKEALSADADGAVVFDDGNFSGFE